MASLKDPTEIINNHYLLNKLSNLNFQELYDLTGIEYTATAVDITSYILRFFNQKTSPHLPVAKAVQMSGSFPVAFQSQVWLKEWGKYYIYYTYIRR